MSVEIRLRGTCSEPVTSTAGRLSSYGIKEHETVHTAAVIRGGGDPVSIEAEDDDILQVEFDDGFVDFMTVKQAREKSGRQRSGADDGFDFPLDVGGPTTRGAFDWVVNKVRRFRFKPPSLNDLTKAKLIDAGVDAPANMLARAIALWVEREYWTVAQPAGVYQVNGQLELFQPIRESEQVEALRKQRDDPYLVLIHGTFSNTATAFQSLVGTLEWNELYRRYGGRVLALEQKTLSTNPVQNALDLVSKLPKQARLHLISHSRGGLVGDLLSLPELPDSTREAFRRARKGEEGSELRDIEKLVDLLRTKEVDVERFARVASPAAGTILASERADDYLKIIFNLMKLMPPVGTHPIFPMVEALTVALISKRTDPNLLPGLEAMMPKSPYIHLLNSGRHKVNDGLAVLAGDVEGSGILGRIKVFATDLFYREDHDLVVNTKSMYLGLPREQALASLQKTSDVDHMTYFDNEVTRSRIVNALSPWSAGQPPRGFQELRSPRAGVSPDNVTRSERADLPRLVFVPAQMASELNRSSGLAVWPERIADEGLDILKSNLTATNIEGHLYHEMIRRLATEFDIEPFAFDWRKSYSETGSLLKDHIEELLAQDDRRIHIVAHSGGGLAPLWLKATASDTWQKLQDRGGHLVLLGTPWLGSFHVLSWLLGRGALVNRLALLDPRRTNKEIGQTLATCPGLLELLPRTTDANYLEQSTWKEIGCESPQGLDAASSVRDTIDSAWDGEGISLIAGQGRKTFVGFDHTSRKFFENLAGDGFVPHALGFPRGTIPWFAATGHDGLVGTLMVAVVRDLLQSGKTERIDRFPQRASAASEIVESAVPVLFPTREDLVLAALGEESEEAPPPDKWVMRVEVLHGSLEYAEYPVLVGHYEGTPIEGAEGFLDRKLNGRLTNRHVLGRYPEEIGQTAVIPGFESVKGAIVVGMGPIGELTQPRLRQIVTDAALAHALQVVDREDRDELGGPRSAAFAAVLVGTNGRHGIPLESSIAAIVEGAVEANEILQQAEFRDQVRIDCVQFIERYGSAAEDAASVIRDAEILPSSDSRDRFLVEPARILREVNGGLPGRPGREYQAGSWSRLMIKSLKPGKDGNPRLEFTSLGRRARAEFYKESVEKQNIEEMIQRTITSREVGQTHNTLFELLVPNDFKHEIRDGGNRVLVVDRISATYPWEMLATKDRAGTPQPLVNQAGILRQLSVDQPRAAIRGPRGLHALVIGDPCGGPLFPRLDGARREAEQVAATLEAHDYQVNRQIASQGSEPSWLDIENALFKRDYRIVHIAAHGTFDETDANHSGVVIGPGRYLTASVIKKLPVVPELVFLNCCHLGRMSSSIDPSLDKTRRNLNRLAATLATELMAIGVRCVVAAGWAVDDDPAAEFATALYTCLFRGLGFGRAVEVARRAADKAGNGRSNTWGAYQCYGDPGYQCYRDPGIRRGYPHVRAASSLRKSPSKPPISQNELVRQLKEIVTRAGDDVSRRSSLLNAVKELERATPCSWRSGEVDYRFGHAFAELRSFEKAVRYYREALSSWDAEAPMKLLEQLGNTEVRYAIQLHRGPNAANEGPAIKDLFKSANDLLKRVQAAYSETPERWALVGSYHKKRATTLTGQARRAEIKRSQEVYRKAHEAATAANKSQPYQTMNWVTMTKLLGKVPREQQLLLDQIVEQRRKEHGLLQQETDFWSRVALPDALLADAVVKGMLGKRADEITTLYEQAFATRSTSRERGAVIEHLGDLIRLLPSQAEVLEQMVMELGGE